MPDDVLSMDTTHYDVNPHPVHEHGNQGVSIEAHSPVPVVQKFQIQKQLLTAAILSYLISPIADPPYQRERSDTLATRILPSFLPFDLKTRFLN